MSVSCGRTKVGALAYPDKTPFVAEDDEGNAANLHPDAIRGPGAEFEGDTNPQTGEVGGPKSDPLKWKSEWAYGGRAVDF